MFFAEAGLNLGFNLVASQTTKISGESKTEDIENVKTVDFGFVIGGGVTVIPNLDINLRAVIGFADMVDDFGDVGTKNLRFQAGVTYWFM